MWQKGASCLGGSDINFDLVVKNGRVFTSTGQMSTEVWIKDGRIAALGGAHRAEERIDARGMLVLPGAIDVHVHFRDPGPNYKEDWASGSASAAAGGVTAVVDQPNTVPRTMDARSFEEKLEIARHRSCVDFALNAGPGKIDELKEAGAQAIGEIFSYEHSDAELAAILSQVGRAGMLASLHAEDGAIIKEKLAEFSGRHDPEVYSLARPAKAEAAAIEKACGISERLHICHLSSAQGLAAVEAGRRAGRTVSAEVAPHHLLLNEKDYPKQGSFLKMNPPLRRKADNDALWQALRSGKIDILASDHAPHLPEEKREDIWEAPPGVPGVETMLPLMLMAVKKNLISLERLVDALSAQPARIFGLAGKGRIERGMDADLVIVDSKAVTEINAGRLHSRAEWTPYQGKQAIFPKMTIVRGRVVWDGDLQAIPGYGRFLGRPITREKQKVLSECSPYTRSMRSDLSGSSDLERMIGKAAVEAARMSSQASQAARKILGDVSSEISETKSFDLVPVDLIETEAELIALVALAGASKENIDLRATEDSLTVDARIVPREGKYLRQEMGTLPRHREIKLPIEIKPEQVKASFRDGILEVRLPKLVVVNAQRVTVE